MYMMLYVQSTETINLKLGEKYTMQQALIEATGAGKRLPPAHFMIVFIGRGVTDRRDNERVARYTVSKNENHGTP